MPMEYPVPDPLDVEQLFNKSKGNSAIIWRDSSGTIHAEGKDGDIATGENVMVVAQQAYDNLASLSPQHGYLRFAPQVFEVSNPLVLYGQYTTVEAPGALFIPSTNFHDYFFKVQNTTNSEKTAGYQPVSSALRHIYINGENQAKGIYFKEIFQKNFYDLNVYSCQDGPAFRLANTVRQCHFTNLNAKFSGTSTAPELWIEPDENTGGDSTNKIEFIGCDIDYPYNQAIRIRSNSSYTRKMFTLDFIKVNFELNKSALANVPASTGDGMEILGVDTIRFSNCQWSWCGDNQSVVKTGLGPNGEKVDSLIFQNVNFNGQVPSTAVTLRGIGNYVKFLGCQFGEPASIDNGIDWGAGDYDVYWSGNDFDVVNGERFIGHPPNAVERVGGQSEVFGYFDSWLDARYKNRLQGTHLVKSKEVIAQLPWEIYNGSPSVSQGVLNLPAGDATTQRFATNSQSYFDTGNFEFEMRLNATPTANNFIFKFLHHYDGAYYNMYQVYLNSAGFLELRVVPAGTNTHTTLIDNSITLDTNWHTIRVTSDRNGTGTYGEWELFYDGTSLGTADNTYKPNYQASTDHTRFKNSMDVSIDIKNLKKY